MLLLFLGIISLSFLLAPVGCTLLWQRYNYFSDGLAHASIFSGIVSYFLNLPQILAMIVVALLFTMSIYSLKFFSNRNNSITIVSTGMVAIAVMISSKIDSNSLINQMLFGDILSLDFNGLISISILAFLSFVLALSFQKELALISLDRDLAKASGVKVNLIELVSLGILGVIIAMTVKIIGALLISALIVTPAATARLISKSPVQMLVVSLLVALISGLSGIILSFIYDLPLSSVIVTICIIIYIIVSIFKYIFNEG